MKLEKMEKVKIIVFIPYFGTLPNYFKAFAHSCKYIKSVDFKIFTDDESIKNIELPENITYELVSFSNICSRITNKELGEVHYAYKLCDYKPLYGILFDEYTQGYEYWGYCDIDTMMGDVDSYLEKINFRKYDRIGDRGHFTLYRNDDTINQLYKTRLDDVPPIFDFSFVKSTTYPCHFDESGMNWICNAVGISYYKNNHEAQTTLGLDLHLHTFHRHLTPELFVWNKGKVFVYYKNSEGLQKQEYMYAHYQDRKDMPINEPLGNKVLITHKGFYNFDETKIDEYLNLYGSVDTDEERIIYIKNSSKNIRKGKIKKLQREIKVCGLRTFYNIYARYKSILFLKKNHLF